MKTLDKNRLFGTVHGDSQGRCFEQDGVCFTASGDEWVEVEPELTPEEVKAAEKAAARTARVAARAAGTPDTPPDTPTE